MKLKKQSLKQFQLLFILFTVSDCQHYKLQQPCVSYGASYSFQYTVACPSRFSYLIKDEKYHVHFYL
jgi:hypothetical protein